MVIGPSGVQLGLQSYKWLTKLMTAKQESNLLIMSSDYWQNWTTRSPVTNKTISKNNKYIQVKYLW